MMQQSSSPAKRRLRSVLDTALIVGSALATVVAVGVVVGLFWWVSSGPSSAPPAASRPYAAVNAAAPAADAPAAPPAAAKQGPRTRHKTNNVEGADQPLPAAVPPAAVPPEAAAAPPAAVPQKEGEAWVNPDVKKNRAIAQGLSRLGQDPEMQRRLAEPPQDDQQE